jgi:hypothetical protein
MYFENKMIKSIVLFLILTFMSGCGGAYLYQVSRVFEPGRPEIRRLVNKPDPHNYAYLMDIRQTVHSGLIIRGIVKGRNIYSLSPVGRDDWIEVGNKEITELPPGEYDIKVWSSIVKRVTMRNERTSMIIESLLRPTVKIQLEENKFYYIATKKNFEFDTEQVVLYEVNRNRFRISDDGTAIEDIGKNDPNFRISSEDPLTIIKSYPPHCVVCTGLLKKK